MVYSRDEPERGVNLIYLLWKTTTVGAAVNTSRISSEDWQLESELKSLVDSRTKSHKRSPISGLAGLSLDFRQDSWPTGRRCPRRSSLHTLDRRSLCVLWPAYNRGIRLLEGSPVPTLPSVERQIVTTRQLSYQAKL